MDLQELREWYNGYRFESVPAVYNPRSVVEAVTSGICDSYWNQTETFEALRMYIDDKKTRVHSCEIEEWEK